MSLFYKTIFSFLYDLYDAKMSRKMQHNTFYYHFSDYTIDDKMKSYLLTIKMKKFL